MKKKCILLVAFIVCIFIKEKQITAQMDPQFTSNMFLQPLINPASVGEADMARAFMNLRNQWSNVGPKTTAAFVETPFNGFKRKHGAALTFLQDKAGLFSTFNINLAYSHKQDIWNGTLSAGVQLGLTSLTWDGSNINNNIINSPFHNDLGIDYEKLKISETSNKFDASIGIHYTDKKQCYGISLSHLARPTLELYKSNYYIYYNRTLNIYGGYNLAFRSLPYLQLKTFALLKTDGRNTQIDLNCNAWYKDLFYIGASYRIQDAIAFLGGIKLKNGILFGGSYDITTSKIAFGGFGSVEAFISYEFSLSLNYKSNKYKSIRIL